MSHIPGSIRAARLKQPRLTSEQFWAQVDRHLGTSFSKSQSLENGECDKGLSLREEASPYQVSGQEWNTK